MTSEPSVRYLQSGQNVPSYGANESTHPASMAEKPGMPSGIPPGDGSGDPPPYAFPTDGAPPTAPPEGLNGGYNYAVLPNYEDPEYAPDLPPPPYQPETEEEKQEHTFTGMSYLTDDAVQHAVIDSAQAHCCYGTKAAREMAVGQMESASALHYGLESFAESRKTNWKEEPYVGQPIDSPMYGPAPDPWSIPVHPCAMFKEEKQHLEIPHTAYVIICHLCHGWGKKRCFSCHGRGYERCSFCDGTGERQEGEEVVRCSTCNGSGDKRCFSCNGCGYKECLHCQGMGRLKKYVQLTVKFEVHDDDHVVQGIDLDFPDKLVKKGSGTTLFEQIYPRVMALYSHPSAELNGKSQEFVQKHATKYSNERILMQKHWLRGVPITKSQCNWDDKPFNVWVYGDNYLVYMPDYPQQCCCGCVLL